MFKKWLLVTTVLFFSGSASFAPAQPNRDIVGTPKKSTHILDPIVRGKHNNRRFLLKYGYEPTQGYGISEYDYASSYSQIAGWTHYAAPIKVRGKAVSEIVVKDMKLEGSPSFILGIYSNTPSGIPGQWITGGRAQARPHETDITIPVPNNVLAKNTKYWVEESVPSTSGIGANLVLWGVNKRKTGYLVQSHRFVSTFSSHVNSTTDWFSGTGFRPYVKLR